MSMYPEADATNTYERADDRPRRLLRSRSNRILTGVCGGLGRYLGIDPVFVRLGAVVLTLISWVTPLLYVIAWFTIPEARKGEEAISVPRSAHDRRRLAGYILVGLGSVMLARQLVPWFEMSLIAPLLLIAAGAFVLLKGKQ